MPRETDRVPLVVLAAGDYPSCGVAVSVLTNAEKVVCCDGAAAEYISKAGNPYAIVGDCDSLPEGLRSDYAGLVHCFPDQQTNDLTKAVGFCARSGFCDIVVLGGTGKREDHAVANISLLAEYVNMPGVNSVRMISDRMVFDAVTPVGRDVKDRTSWLPELSGTDGCADMAPVNVNAGSSQDGVFRKFTFESVAGQQVSIFTPIAGVRITTHGLRYPLEDAMLSGWWAGTLNESLSDKFEIETTGPIIICRVF